jgi:hypothetical protein
VSLKQQALCIILDEQEKMWNSCYISMKVDGQASLNISYFASKYFKLKAVEGSPPSI